MSAFSSAFSPAFSGAAAPVAVVYHQPAFSLDTHVGRAVLFDTSAHYVCWSAAVMIGSVDVSDRLSGTLTISGAEESARTAHFEVTPLSSEELFGYDNAPVTIDITVFRGMLSATYRRFTGVVEGRDFSESEMLCSISCRDGYQERIKAAGRDAIHSLLGGLHTASDALCAWSDSTPDPVGYFDKLLGTVPGSVFINGAGFWRSFRWDVGSPRAVFGLSDFFDGSLATSFPARIDIPSSIKASLSVRVNRLHAVEVPLSWEGVSYIDYAHGLGSWLGKATVLSALAGLSGWFIKGKPVLGTPESGYVVPTSGGGVSSLLIGDADKTCISLDVTMYKRWYQEVDYKLSFEIALGGLSDRDESISEAIQSTWDAAGWEDVASSDNTVDLYVANAPTVTVTPTGYEALPEPWPPANGAVDHYPDLSGAPLNSAARYVAARALRLAAAGLRRRTVQFDRPIDPRWDISDVLGVVGRKVSATGQVTEFADLLDFESGDATTSVVLACPQGNAATTVLPAFTVPSIPCDVTHALTAPVLGNHLGSIAGMVPATDEDTLQGFLCNVDPTAPQFDGTKPAFAPQFRIIMPAIAALHRDPSTLDVPLTVDFQLADGAFLISF